MKLSQSLPIYEVDQLNDGFSPTTICIYINALKHLVKYLNDPEIDTITERHLRSFFGYLRTQYGPVRSDHKGRLSSASLHRYWKAVRSYFKWSKREIKLPPPDTEIKMPIPEYKEIDPYTQLQVQKLLIALEISAPVYKQEKRAYSWPLPDRLRNRAIILTLMDTGIRPSELCRITMDDLDLHTGRIFIKPFQRGKTISGWAYIEKRAQQAIKDYLSVRGKLETGDFLFTQHNGRPLTQVVLSSLFRRLGTKAGVPHCNTYRFRHTFAIEFLRNGGDAFSLQVAMRHQNISTTRRYVKFLECDISKIHKRISPTEHWAL